MISPKWDLRFLHLAQHIAEWSKDPSTRTGAVIVDGDKRIVATGYNGFPRGVADDERLHDRETKYRLIVHCERNALLFARQSLDGGTLYTWPFMSCAPCAAMVIQSGILRCVAPETPAHLAERWGTELATAAGMFAEAKVTLDLIPWTELSWSETPS